LIPPSGGGKRKKIWEEREKEKRLTGPCERSSFGLEEKKGWIEREHSGGEGGNLIPVPILPFCASGGKGGKKRGKGISQNGKKRGKKRVHAGLGLAR